MRTTLLMPIMLLIAGCQMTVPFNTAPAPKGATQLQRIDGRISYRQRIALPPDAVAIVDLIDISRADAAAPVIATTRIPTQGRQVPIDFSLDYDPVRILPNMRYALRARITNAAGTLMWTTDTAFPLSFAGEPVELMMVQAGRN